MKKLLNLSVKTIRENIKEWWLERHKVIDFSFGVALSHLCVRIIVLDYGIRFRIELPYILNKLNPINLLTNNIFKLILKFRKNKLACVWLEIGKWKTLEFQMLDSCEIISFNYKWTVHCDHWGHETTFAFAGLESHAWFNDCRHWDYDKDAPELIETESETASD